MLWDATGGRQKSARITHDKARNRNERRLIVVETMDFFDGMKGLKVLRVAA